MGCQEVDGSRCGWQGIGGWFSGRGEDGKRGGGEKTRWQGSKWALARSGWPGVVRGRGSKCGLTEERTGAAGQSWRRRWQSSTRWTLA